MTMRSSSWVISEIATGKIIAETFDQAKVNALNISKYKAVPILEHLSSLTNIGTGGVLSKEP